jgi:uncharacterized membrane protein YdjX (TVP38/TMEM64 family)
LLYPRDSVGREYLDHEIRLNEQRLRRLFCNSVVSVRKKLYIGAAVAVLVGVLWATGALSGLSDPEHVKSLVERAGPFGPVVFILISMLLFSVFLLGPPTWASGAIWPLPLAILYCCIAAIGASLLTYGFARLVAQSWAQEHVSDKLRSYEDRLEARPFLTVLTLRLLLWANPMVDLLVGVSRVSFSSYLSATIVGLLPTTALQIVIGRKGIELATQAPVWLWAVILVVVVLGLLLRRRQNNSSAEQTTPVDP